MSSITEKDYSSKVSARIGVDLDRTLAHYEKWVAADVIGPPIPAMVERVKAWIKLEYEVRIFTARVAHDGSTEMFERSELARTAIQQWCRQHIGKEPNITCVKDLGCIAIYDDIARQVIPNTGCVLDIQ